jgi:hypothetical protein
MNTCNNKTKNKIIIAIDNDECIGSWGDLSLVYSIIKYNMFFQMNDEIIDIFVELLDVTGCVRPNLKILYDNLIKLKKEDKIHGIYMFTSASDSFGWVCFLKNILERWYSKKIGENVNIYDHVINGNDINKWHNNNSTVSTSKTGTIKNMDMIREIINNDNSTDKINVIMLDDRPENVINGHVIGITPYKVAINLIEICKLYFQHHISHIDIINYYYDKLNESWNIFQLCPWLFTLNAYEDNHIILCSETIHKIIDEYLT